MEEGESLSSTNSQNAVLGIVAVAILAGIVWVTLHQPGGSATTAPAPETAASMRAGVLSPTIFNDPQTQAAYQVAADIPEVLDQLPCFCGCKTGFGHKSNLFCFKDQHGAGCDMCQRIALDARRMHDEGMSIAQIQTNINAKYGPQPVQQ